MTSSASTETFVNSARGFQILMITSIDHTGRFDGRPMTLLAVEDEGTMWFACPSDSDLVTQFGRPAPISITGQTSSAYLHTNGIAKAIVDEDKAKKVWSETLRPWFPNGPTSDDLILIQVTPQAASVWDSGITDMLSFAWEAVKAVVSGEKINNLDGRKYIDMTEPHAAAK